MTTKQFFQGVLEQIFKSQQSFKVKTSIFLKRIDQYLFEDKGPQSLSAKQAQLLFLGIPQKKYQGLFELAGVKGTFGGLKKSAFFALEIIYKCVTKSKFKQIFLKTYIDCDQEDFKLLRLATHISQAQTQQALQLCSILKTKRPYLNESDYIFSDDSRKIFIKWFEAQKKKQKKAQNLQRMSLNPAILPGMLTGMQENNNQGNNPSKFTSTSKSDLGWAYQAIMNISTNLQAVQYYEDYIIEDQQDYLLDTFVNTIDILQNHRQNPQIRQVLSYRQFIYYLIITPITKISRNIIQSHIHKIHIQSSDFNPDYLIQKFHSKLNNAQKTALSKVIPLHFGIEYRKNLVRYYFENFIELAKSVTLIKDNFAESENIKNDASVAFSLRTQMKQSMKVLCDKVEPLSQKYEETEKLRKFILFLQTNSQLIKMPTTIKKFLDERNFLAISTLYRKYQNLIEIYKNTAIVKDILDEIENMMILVRISQIQNAIKRNFQNQKMEILVDLFMNKKQAIVEYLIPRMIMHLIRSMDKEITSPDIQIIDKKTKKYEMLNFGKIVEFQDEFTDFVHDINGDFDYDQGDLLEQFLSSLKKQHTIKQKCHLIKQKLLVKFKNFFLLIKKWSQEYNIFFEELKILIYVMTVWYAKIIEEIIDEKAYQMIYIMSQILMIAENNADGTSLTEKITKLKQSNFVAYCMLITQKSKHEIQFKKYPIKRDLDGNYFNDLLVKILDCIVANVDSIFNFPSYAHDEFFLMKVYKYIQNCIIIQDNKLLALPELFTYSTLLSCLNESKITQPFYSELTEFKQLKQHLKIVLKKRISKIDAMLYSIIKIQYLSTINHKKSRQFALLIMQYLNENCYILNQYSIINYKKHSRFMIEGFQQIAMQVLPQIKENQDNAKNFIRQLELIKAMTNKIQSKRIMSKWEHLLKQVEFTEEEKSEKEIYVLENKHKFSANFCGLIQY